MIVKLLTEHDLEFLCLKGGCRGFPSLYMSKHHIVGNHMHWLNYTLFLKLNNEHNWSVQRIGFIGVKSLLKHSCIAIKWIKNIGIDRQML